MSDETAKPSTLAAALVAAQAQAGKLDKDSKNEFSRYMYTSTETIISAAKECLSHHGLAVVGGQSEILDQVIEKGNASDGSSVKLSQEFHLIHESGEEKHFTREWPIVPAKGKPPDKAMASAETTLLGYFLRDLLQFARTEESADMDRRDTRGGGRQPSRQQAAPPAAPPETGTRNEPPTIDAALKRLMAEYDSVVKGEGVEPVWLDKRVTWGKLAKEGMEFTYRDAIDAESNPTLNSGQIRHWMEGVIEMHKKELGDEVSRLSAWSPRPLMLRIVLAWRDVLLRQYDKDLKAAGVDEFDPGDVEVIDPNDIPDSTFEHLFRSLKNDAARRKYLKEQFGVTHYKGTKATTDELVTLAIASHEAKEGTAEGVK